MSTIIKKCKICYEIEVGKVLRLLLLSQVTNIENNGFFSALKGVKIYLRSTIGNNWLHALMLVHIHKNILDKVYLVDVVNEFVDGRDSCKLREFIE